ncbi:hypothetical protein KDA_19160 [Dictyobacter alpinus]|uniref:histidine kinase n=2 Tax=Dictyobacter alpinus TaxID=2014873 RepID=A0A402B520_9CHLR|nr:hypothetical protein KDA_19160 [Dictyobacter alpinus]
MFIPFLEASLGIKNYFIGAQFFIVTAFIGLFWGLGPALFSVLLGIFALQYFIIPPTNSLTVFNWRDELSFIPFLLAQLVVVSLIVLRERMRQHLQVAEQDARTRVEELAASNQALAESNAKLAQLDQLKDRFIAQASHELKTPITTIRGQVQVASRQLSKQKELPDSLAALPTQLDKVEKQTRRLHALLDDLLDLSSLHSGSIPLRRSSCDIGQLCHNVVEDQAALTGRHIKLNLPTSPLTLYMDGERIAQVMANLITNAIKYSPEGTEIQVNARQEQANLLLQVHNLGPGIPQEQQAEIFEPFYRTPGARSSTTRGWGLGLAISKEIVERHGGHMWVESAEGTGTTFFVSLPIQSDQEKGM